MKTAVIGTGNMGGALVKGWCKAGMASDLIITAHTQRTLDTITAQYPEVTATLELPQSEPSICWLLEEERWNRN